ncbi:hypothetical protein M0R45_027982 [Rubus argutus]|uniref:Wall-associated receptor kinase galacturonan-binding domain-containing protein n=1 Tax=Rubus argutus TaxID=59490 RepID=A0AAW1W499_RUBAR
MPKSILITCALICFAIYHDDVKAEKHCPPASCGDLHDIRYPFRLKSNGTYANNCSNYPAELSCVQNRTILNLYNGTYYVLGIYYESLSIQVVDPGLLRDTCPFRPIHRLTEKNFSGGNFPYYSLYYYATFVGYDYATFYDCLSLVESPDYIKNNCSNSSSSSSSTSYSYIKLGRSVNHLLAFCNITAIIPSMLYKFESRKDLSFSFIRDKLRIGFQLSWSNLVPDKYCYRRSQSLYCFGEYLKRGFIQAAKITGCSLTVRMVLGIIVLLTFWSYKLYWKKFLKDDAIEKFSNMPTEDLPDDSDATDIEEVSTLPQSATESTSMV